MRLFGVILIGTALLIALYAAVVYVGVERGTALRRERLEVARASEIATQVARAQEDIDAGNTSLASRRLTWILEQNPQHEAAQLLVEYLAIEAGSMRDAQSPGDVTATPPLTETVDRAGEDGLAGELRRIESVLATEAYEEAIRALISFQHNYPDYQRRRSDELLHEAYMEQGVELLYGDQIEVGLYYLEQARRLGELPQDVRDQQHWAELYLAGMGYYGVNWDVTLFYFRDLCLAAPFFHDACEKLHAALVAFGNQYAVQQDWCPAESYYAEAYRQDASNDLSQKLSNAREGCASATPTPAAPITGTIPVSGTAPIGDTVSPNRNIERP